MMEIKKNVLKYVKGFDSFAKKKPNEIQEDAIPLLDDKLCKSSFASTNTVESN